MSEVRELVENLSRQVAEITGKVPNEAKIKAMVDEALAPLEKEIQAQASKRVFTASTRDQALAGTRFERLEGWTADDVEFMHDILDVASSQGIGGGPSEKLRNLHTDINTRAMDTAESGYGSEIVGVGYIGELWRSAYQESVIFGQVPSFEMRYPSEYLPVAAAFPEMMLVSENTAADASAYSTSKTGSNQVNVAAKKFIIHQMYSGEMEEDSIIPYIPFLRDMAAKSLGYYSDSLILNGDTTNAGTGNINLDDADPTDTKHYLAADGLRHAALVDNTGNASDVAAAITSVATLLALRKLMLDTTYKQNWGYPQNPNDLIYVCSFDDLEVISGIDEVLTVDKIGAQATVIQGQQAKIGRHPLVATMAMSLTEADGSVSTTAGNNTKGQIVAFNRLGTTVGWRRRVKFETERLPGRDQTRIIWSLRLGVGRYTPTGAAAGIEHVAVAYDTTV